MERISELSGFAESSAFASIFLSLSFNVCVCHHTNYTSTLILNKT